LGQHSGNYLAFFYVVVKLLYIGNAAGQLFLLNLFMGDRFHWYGFEMIQKWFYGQTMEAIERFPRITMCRFTLRTLGDNIQPYDVQCLLPINIYNEKVRSFSACQIHRIDLKYVC
jgi:innexin